MNNLKGGYSIIDCTGLDLSDLGTVTGLYNQLSAAIASDKPITLRGLVNGNQAFTPIVAYGGTEEGGVFVSFYPVTLHVTSADVVTM